MCMSLAWPSAGRCGTVWRSCSAQAGERSMPCLYSSASLGGDLLWTLCVLRAALVRGRRLCWLVPAALNSLLQPGPELRSCSLCHIADLFHFSANNCFPVGLWHQALDLTVPQGPAANGGEEGDTGKRDEMRDWPRHFENGFLA